VHDESPIVGAELQGMRPFAPMPWLSPPVVVLGGAADRFIPVDEVWRTAAYFGTRPVILPDVAHTLMLDTRWEKAAEALLAWLRGLAPES
jgi:pimeloyl-ACP methyl ester carboxylesterase